MGLRDSRRKLLGGDVRLVVLTAAVVTQVVFLLYLQWGSYNSLVSGGDLGAYSQALYNTLHGGRFMGYDQAFPGNISSILQVHFSPILIFVSPLFAVWPSPLTLLVIKQVVLALGALPVYGIALRMRLAPNWSLALGLGYLVTPLTALADWTNFDPEVFLPVLVLGSIWAALASRRWMFLILWLLALMTIESAAVLLTVVAFVWVTSTVSPSSLRHPGRTLSELPVQALLVAVVWLGVAFACLDAFSPHGGAFGAGYGDRFTVLGATSIPGIPIQVLTHPNLAIAAFSYDLRLKLEYDAIVLGCAAFLVLLGPVRYIVAVVAWLGFIDLSNAPVMYALGTQYQCYLTAFLIAGGIAGAQNVVRWSEALPALGQHLKSTTSRAGSRPGASITSSRSLRATRAGRIVRRDWAVVALISAVILAGVAVNPLAPRPADSSRGLLFGPTSPSEHETLVANLLGMIPQGAPVFTTINYYPYVATRTHAFALGESQLYSGNWTFRGAVDYALNHSDYALIDYGVTPLYSVVTRITADLNGFSVIGAAGGAYLYIRGAGVRPGYFVPIVQEVPPRNLTLHNSAIDHSLDGPMGPPLFYQRSDGTGGPIWSGPSIWNLPAGQYSFTLALRIHSLTAGKQLLVRVTHQAIEPNITESSNSAAGHRYTFGLGPPSGAVSIVGGLSFNTTSAGVWQGDLTGTFAWDGAGFLSIDGSDQSGEMAMYLYGISIQQLSAA